MANFLLNLNLNSIVLTKMATRVYQKIYVWVTSLFEEDFNQKIDDDLI